MNAIKKIWDALNGNKTTIGTCFLLVCAFLNQVVITKWQVAAPWVLHTYDVLEWLGMAIGGVGLTHKAVKWVVPAEEKKLSDEVTADKP